MNISDLSPDQHEAYSSIMTWVDRGSYTKQVLTFGGYAGTGKTTVVGLLAEELPRPGTHHGRIEPKHLQAYLNEYVFRFNRRFYPMTAFNSVLGLAVRTVPPTYAQLYSGAWVHPGGQPTSPQIAMPFA